MRRSAGTRNEHTVGQGGRRSLEQPRLEVREVSHCDRIMHALRDGEFHTTASLYREVGPCILHSRISDLRAKGHIVEGRHVPGRSGANGYEYRLAPSVTFVDVPRTVRQPIDPSPRVSAAEQQLVIAGT